MKRVFPILKFSWLVICLFFVWLWSDDFYTALETPEIYHFGSEGPIDLWWYKNQKAYLISGAILVFWFFIGSMLCMFQHKRERLKYGIVAHIFITIIYFVFVIIYIRMQ